MKPFDNTKKSVFGKFMNLALVSMMLITGIIMFSPAANAQTSQVYSGREVIDAGHRFFGATSGNLASAFERTFAKYGLPNGYILGEEAGGAFIGGLRYGEGYLYTKNAGDHKVFWQGPSIGWDYGGDGNRTMMLVYNLDEPGAIYRRFVGVEGAAYFVGGAGITFHKNGNLVLAPIRTGLGLRLGANVGYLKITQQRKFNPF